MEWSENLKPASNYPPESRTEGFSSPGQGFLQGPTNINPRPPVFFVPTGVRHVLNYSFQTGEEFALGFMQERASNSREPSLLPTTSEEQSYADQRTVPISPHVGLRSASDAPATNAVLETEKKGPPSLRRFALGASSEDVRSPGFGKRYDDSPVSSELPPTKMKFLCSFGGKFLPRPGDGKLRYVGGYNHVLQLNKDISWRELLRRTRKLCNKFHAIKYQLPGENINLLISVSSDEDLHLMMDECRVLEDGEHKPRIFLFSSEDGDVDDGSVHSNVGKIDADAERQYVIAVNGLDGSGDAFNKRASASATEMDQLMFELGEAKMSKSASSSATVSAMDLITPLKTPSKPIQVKQHIGVAAYLKNQDNEEQFEEDDMYLYSGHRHQDIFFNKDSNIFFPSPVPTESTTYPSKHKQGITNFSKPLNELKTLPRIVDGLHGEMRIADGEVPRKEIKAKEDSVSEKNDEAALSWHFTDKLPVPTKQHEGSPSDNVPAEPSNAASRVFQTERILREQVEPLIRLAKSDDLIGFQQLGLNENYIMTEESTTAGKSADLSPGGHLNSSDMLSSPAQVPEDVILQIPKSKDFGDAQLNQGEQMFSLEESERSHKSLHKLRSHGSQEDAASQVEKRIDGESYRNSFGSQRKIEKSDKENGVQTTVRSVELKFSPAGAKSCNRSQESPSSTSSPSTPSGNRTAKMCDKFSQCGSQDQGYSLLKISLTRSLENDGSSLLVLNRSHELREDVREANQEQEEYEAERVEEIGLPAVDAISRDLNISNVQIIKNDDLEDLREVGAGTFGTVYHGKWRGTDVAIKRIKNSCFLYHSSQTDKLILEFWREAGILSKLHHPNVVAFYGVVKDGPGGKLATVTEFMVSGSLKKVLLRRDKYLDRRKRLMLAMDAAIGMEYLHSKNIVHFDLKCDNLLVNLKDSSRPICKVADFGLSKMKQTTMVSGGMRGTLPWMAPELLTINSNRVSDKVDVYSFGVVMWEILTGEEPYGDMHYGAVIGGILNNTLRPSVPSSCDVEWRKLMEQCWAANPDQRPSFTQIAAQLRSMLDAVQA
ncbi:MAP kinase kinase kinase mkh1-like isoform X1 [Ananas comosus]|uniref:MAP kinase kinase kinase mkh1-like isoform X1 n=1 Tax=Ananas comosus TaxID=4615 RepID=A0A6P5F0X0_ANACO|nr:MAP kinase kinase kinase mkh1-like isoform X1 [Ananas comosus]XP_020089489.1 MAP kinase kinase kinase mkh1-like isoform X1 [Ananas comosus]XP_020089495.1 MAP kinase kinase kinase mkh1-like isoform X1 [Ananas comosus]XP_020089503.1 MAP kinase kinase kinase mkh1-like isoform X1 [Ananas comosus]